MGESSDGRVLVTLTFLVTCTVWISESASQRVYYSCGAVVDSDTQGIILSPGFPNNYSPGTHCVWQFFIPAGAQLLLDVFEFDVFASPSDGRIPLEDFLPSAGTHSPQAALDLAENGDVEEESRESNQTSSTTVAHTARKPTRGGKMKVWFNQTIMDSNWKPSGGNRQELATAKSNRKLEDQEVVVQEQSTKLEMVKTSKPPSDHLSVTVSPLDVLDMNDSVKPILSWPSPHADIKGEDLDPRHNSKRLRPQTDHLPEEQGQQGLSDSTVSEVESSVTPPPSLDVCPNDVLYISDLITFSSRFCGSNSPMNQTLRFGSSLEMIEVVMELITTTDRGRGFVLLYQFQAMGGVDIHTVIKHADRDNLILTSVIGGAVLFTVVLLTVLCLARRQKVCSKGISSRGHENGIQNSAADISELQLVVANGTSQELSTENENNNHSVSLERVGNSVHTEMEVTSTVSAVTESGSDEVFVISAGPGLGTLHFSSFKTKNPRNLKRSVTSPATVCDCLMPETVGGPEQMLNKHKAEDGQGSPPRPRAWSVRTFQDFLAPLPQLRREWRSWTTASPFTKLVENSGTDRLRGDGQPEINRKVLSDVQLEAKGEYLCSSSGSTASYPLTQSAHCQRKLLTPTNLKRTWFGSPCFGFQPSSPHRAKPREPATHPGPARQALPQYESHSPGHKVPAESATPYTAEGLQTDPAQGRDLATDTDRTNVTKPVFVISEESDAQQPLVLGPGHVGQFSDCAHFETNRSSKASDAHGQKGPVNRSESSLTPNTGAWINCLTPRVGSAKPSSASLTETGGLQPPCSYTAPSPTLASTTLRAETAPTHSLACQHIQ
ncbi:uncharacterized protein si:dkey-112e17.1 isoform X1 [Callorhinchus milii]|uniref:uncharacterized protein si:dkey-112e17.1 isoform X1 n=1 Tax=Callorhinchus milii TaxID=7868 RepID=UPI001C3FB2F1|nr:uncharacterized protein si:dkey-112e17.1 isoform X1 [Callorhinchus milii]